MTFVLLVILVTLIFTYTNGFHDTANSIATVVSTRVLTPRQAIILATVFNLIGALAGTAVANVVGKGLVQTSAVTMGTSLDVVAVGLGHFQPGPGHFHIGLGFGHGGLGGLV